MEGWGRYPLLAGWVHRNPFKLLTKGAGVAFIALRESELTFLLSKESHYLSISTVPEPTSAKTLLAGLQHSVKGSPASWAPAAACPLCSAWQEEMRRVREEKGFGACSVSQTASATSGGLSPGRTCPNTAPSVL